MSKQKQTGTATTPISSTQKKPKRDKRVTPGPQVLRMGCQLRVCCKKTNDILYSQTLANMQNMGQCSGYINTSQQTVQNQYTQDIPMFQPTGQNYQQKSFMSGVTTVDPTGTIGLSRPTKAVDSSGG